MKKNTKVTVDAGMIASIVAAAVAKAMEQYITATPVAPVAPSRRTPKSFSEALEMSSGVKVSKKWTTLKPMMVENITLAERKIQAEAFKKAMAMKVGYMQACYAGYHAVANSR